MEDNTLNGTADNTTSENKSGSGNGGKLFTQEQVNEIIQSRLGRFKQQAEATAEAALKAKEAELAERENKLLIREELTRRGMSLDLADVLTCTGADDLKTKLDVIQKTFENNAGKDRAAEEHAADDQNGFRVGYPGSSLGAAQGGVDPVRKAMGLAGRD